MLTMIRSRHALTYAQLRQCTIGFGETTCKLRITIEFFVKTEKQKTKKTQKYFCCLLVLCKLCRQADGQAER